jgi:MmyB-like transcription regulator ligand binding domain
LCAGVAGEGWGSGGRSGGSAAVRGAVPVAVQQIGRRSCEEGEPVGGEPVRQGGQERVTAVDAGQDQALQLDEAERDHLFDLARACEPRPARLRRSKEPGVTAGVQQVLDAITDAPAWVRNARHDLLAANRMARALYAPLLADPRRPANTARFIYLDPASRVFFTDWDRAADDIAAMLRSEAGRNPYDKKLVELIGELSTRSDDFRTRWAAHNVRFHRTGHKKLHHLVVGDLDLSFEAMELPSQPGLTLLVYTAPHGSPTADGLALLASWAATAGQVDELIDGGKPIS